MKARAKRIEAGLPTYLGNEIMRTAGYIANRKPMQKKPPTNGEECA